MLKNKTSILITIGILLAIAIGLQFINNQEKESTKGIKAIPLDAAFIIESNNFPELINKLNAPSNKFTQEFSGIKEWKTFYKQIEFLDTLFERNHDVKKVCSAGRTICSGHLIGKDKIEFLYVLPINSGKDEDILRNFIAGFTEDTHGNERAKIMQRSYEGFYVYNMFYFDENDKDLSFNYTFADGLFIFSFSKIIFEESVRMLHSKGSLSDNKDYVKVSKIAGKNVDANIFINYKFFPNSINNLINTSKQEFYRFAEHFASWSILDVKIKNDALLMSGFTQSNDSLNNYLNIFKNQDNIENNFLDILPENTAGIIAVNLSNAPSFRQEYVKYLKTNRQYQQKKVKLDQLATKFNYNFAEDFYEYIEGAVCIAYLPDKIPTNEPIAIGILQINDTEQLSEQLKELSKTRIQTDTSISLAAMAPVILDTKEKITANIFPAPKLFSLLFGKAFADIDAQYYILLDDYLISAKSIKDLKDYYKNYKMGLVMTKNKSFVEFSNSLSSESNIFLYSNFFYGKSLFNKNLSKKYTRIYNNNIESFDKLQAAALQFGVEKDVFFTGLSIKFNPEYNEKPKNIWQIQMNANLGMKPQLVVNHYTGNKEVLVQDSENNLYLYATNGKLLWKRSLPEKILGSVHQIDFYKNNKLQLLFNTRSFIFLIDRKGRDVENYPIKFKSPASNGIAVFDYENKKNYRIFVACENKAVYLLDKYASKVSGWEFDKTQSSVKMPLKHFTYKGKDYIVFSDEQNIYILNRRGQTRIALKAQFEKAQNSEIYFDEVNGPETATFITTGKTGIVYFIFLDGTVKKMTLGTFSPNHNFKYGELMGNHEKYFIFSDDSKVSVYKGDKSLAFEKDFENSIGNTLNLYKIGNTQLIGFSVNTENKVYLFTHRGEIVKGFPMEGSGVFSIGKLKPKTDKFNLITGSSDHILYNYILK